MIGRQTTWITLVLLALGVLLIQAPLLAQDEQPTAEPTTDQSTQKPAKPPASVEESKIRPIKILLSGFENDDADSVHETLKADFLARIQTDQLQHVTLDITDDLIQGTTLTEAARNAAKLGQNYGYDLLVWGGSSGLVSMVSVTSVKAEVEGFDQFLYRDFTQSLQFHLDLRFGKAHLMVSDTLFGLADLRAGNYERAIQSLQRVVKNDPRDVMELNAVRMFLSAAHLELLKQIQNPDQGQAAIRSLYGVLDHVKRMGNPELYGSVKAMLANVYLEMIKADPDHKDTYQRKAHRSLTDALEVFKDDAEPKGFLEKQLKDLEASAAK